MIKVHTLAEGIAEIVEFLKNSPDIIVFDSHSFSLGIDQEWSDDTHR